MDANRKSTHTSATNLHIPQSLLRNDMQKEFGVRVRVRVWSCSFIARDASLLAETYTSMAYMLQHFPIWYLLASCRKNSKVFNAFTGRETPVGPERTAAVRRRGWGPCVSAVGSFSDVNSLNRLVYSNRVSWCRWKCNSLFSKQTMGWTFAIHLLFLVYILH